MPPFDSCQKLVQHFFLITDRFRTRLCKSGGLLKYSNFIWLHLFLKQWKFYHWTRNLNYMNLESSYIVAWHQDTLNYESDSSRCISCHIWRRMTAIQLKWQFGKFSQLVWLDIHYKSGAFPFSTIIEEPFFKDIRIRMKLDLSTL